MKIFELVTKALKQRQIEGTKPRAILMTNAQAEELEKELSESLRIPKPEHGLWQILGMLIVRKDAEIIDIRKS